MLIRFIFRVNHIFTAIQHVAVAQNWHIPGSNATEKNTTGLKAIPPRRGTTPWWILRSSGMSNRFLRKEIKRIWGISTPAESAHTINTKIELTVQNKEGAKRLEMKAIGSSVRLVVYTRDRPPPPRQEILSVRRAGV